MRPEALEAEHQLDDIYNQLRAGLLSVDDYIERSRPLRDIDDAYRLLQAEKKYLHGTVSKRELDEARHTLSCLRQRSLREKATSLMDHAPHFEIRWNPFNACPGCAVAIRRDSCLAAGPLPEDDPSNAIWCSPAMCCCPRCGAQILDVGLEEYEMGCKRCGRPVGPGAARRCYYGDKVDGVRREWICSDCFS
jgi:hypothetical protein